MKHIFAFLLLMIIPTFCFGYDFFDKSESIRLRHMYKDTLYKLDIETIRAICNKTYSIAQKRKWPPVKVFDAKSKNCVVLDLKCNETDDKETLDYFVLASGEYYFFLLNHNIDMCETAKSKQAGIKQNDDEGTQRTSCEQLLLTIVEKDVKNSIRISGYTETPKISVQCSFDDDYCVANWPCIGGSRPEGTICYSCKKIVNKSCDSKSVNLQTMKRGFGEKNLTDFDKDCKPLF